MECPVCNKEFEPCYLCRGQYNHQRCVDDSMCQDCKSIDNLKSLKVRLKAGEYDGKDIMKAWIAIDELIGLKNNLT